MKMPLALFILARLVINNPPVLKKNKSSNMTRAEAEKYCKDEINKKINK